MKFKKTFINVRCAFYILCIVLVFIHYSLFYFVLIIFCYKIIILFISIIMKLLIKLFMTSPVRPPVKPVIRESLSFPILYPV